MPTVEIPLTQGKAAIVDECDLPLIDSLKWRAMKAYRGYYAVADAPGPKPRKRIYMHRLLLAAGPDDEVDHADGDGLNNSRSSNIRIATPSQNQMNKTISGESGFKGVHRHKSGWRARITHCGRKVSLGCFSSAIDAARAYDRAAAQLFGDFAKLNF